MVREELRVLVLAANDLREDGGLNAMSVYSLLWIDPAMKQSTQVRCEGGRYPVWNEELVFSLGEDVLLFPHSTITIKVYVKRVHLASFFCPPWFISHVICKHLHLMQFLDHNSH